MRIARGGHSKWASRRGGTWWLGAAESGSRKHTEIQCSQMGTSQPGVQRPHGLGLYLLTRIAGQLNRTFHKKKPHKAGVGGQKDVFVMRPGNSCVCKSEPLQPFSASKTLRPVTQTAIVAFVVEKTWGGGRCKSIGPNAGPNWQGRELACASFCNKDRPQTHGPVCGGLTGNQKRPSKNQKHAIF